MMFASHLDAARSQVIGRALLDPLSELRTALDADVSYLIFQRAPNAAYDIVSGNCADADSAFLPGERITIRHNMNLHLPRSVKNLKMASQLRSFATTLASALVVPWRHADGQAWLVVGNLGVSSTLTDVSSNARALDLLEAVKRSYVTGSLRGSRRLDRLFRDSTLRLLEAERSFDTPTLLNSIATIARWLFDTSSAYVSLPSSEGDKFNFVATECIRTTEFRELSLGLDEGIGGLARRTRSPVRTTDYAQDPRLQRAPRKETMQEGFKSAACTPLWWDGRVNGLLYIAHRDYRAFNDIDLSLLEQFGNQSADALSLDNWRQFHLESARRAERERLANKLHDNVVRHLLDVGITASMSSSDTSEPSLKATLEHIQQRAQICLDAVRDCISDGTGARRAVPVALGTIAAQFETVHFKSGMTREITLGPGCELAARIPSRVADALAVIGTEALSNADRHSRGRTVGIRLEREGDDIRMRIEDDGRGIDDCPIIELLDRPGHLGLQRMRAIAQASGGGCRFERSERGGLRIDARLPLQPAG
jgi:signal transduction histidine kinase